MECWLIKRVTSHEYIRNELLEKQYIQCTCLDYKTIGNIDASNIFPKNQFRQLCFEFLNSKIFKFENFEKYKNVFAGEHEFGSETSIAKPIFQRSPVPTTFQTFPN